MEADVLLNVFEAVDVIALIQAGGDYDNLNLTVGEALLKRNDVCFSWVGKTLPFLD